MFVDGETGGGDQVDFGKDRPDMEPEMDMTPMVDVTFLLLIFFMVTAAFSLQKTLPVPTPKDDQASTQPQEDPEKDPDFVTVVVDEFNTFYVTCSEFENKEAPSRHELILLLKDARNPGSGAPPPTKLMVKASGEAMHEAVVTAMDAGTIAGMDEIQLMELEDDI